LINGKWFEQGSAASTDAALVVQGDQFQLRIESESITQTIKQGGIGDIVISDRLGNVQRKLTFDDGSVFSTTENDAVDRYLHTSSKNQFIHTLESNLSFVLVALALTVVFAVSFFKWGVPAISYSIAEALPQKTNNVIGSHTFEFLDKYIFDESAIDEERQNEIRTHFEQKLVSSYKSQEKIDFTLHFRDWSNDGVGIPNALALPSGDIIVTDKFIELSENQNEIDSVLLHEIGHIAHRHSLKMVIQSTIVTTAIMTITGDANGLADMGIGLGALLLSANYSRDYESEADQFAFDKMLEIGIDPIAFANIMQRMMDYSEELMGSGKQKNESDDTPDKENSTDSEISDYFSTHPSTDKRKENAERYSNCFKQGLKTCL
jgi:Zn-dependent protease with chaperone function